MSSKKFVAPDMRQALKMVRDELGPDAVILSNRKVPAGVEILAAVDYNDMVDRHHEKQRERQRIAERGDVRIPGFMDNDTAFPPSLADAGSRVVKPLADRRDADAGRQKKPAPARAEGLLSEVLAARASGKPAVASTPMADRRVDAAAYDAQARELFAMRSELNKMRAMLDSRFAHVAWSDFRHQNPVQAAAYKQLHRMGVSVNLCRRYVQSLDAATVQDGMRQIMSRMGRDVGLYPNDIRDVGGVYAFVGPAGVGKTTSISKIAASYALRHGTEDIALVTTDSYRIAGHEQLRTLGKILNVPVRVVTDEYPLDTVLEELSHKRLVLIDTAGLGRRDQDFAEQMNLLDTLPEHVTRVLVLASTSQKRILEKAVSDYQNLRVDACILTKLDECASLGEALSVVIESGLPLVYTTDGQNIPDDIMRPHVADMINQALVLARESELEDQDTADWYDEKIAGAARYSGAA